MTEREIQVIIEKRLVRAVVLKALEIIKHEDQPRDEKGRWVSDGGGGITTAEERQKKIDSINIDFESDNILPELNQEDLSELGKNSKPVLLKKSVINRNLEQHPEVAKTEYNRILGETLYNSDDKFGGKAHHNPNYINFIKFGEKRGALTLVELADAKENFEIVHIFEPSNKKIQGMRPK